MNDHFVRGWFRGAALGIAVGNLFGAALLVLLNRPAVGVIGFSFISGVMAMAFIAASIKTD